VPSFSPPITDTIDRLQRASSGPQRARSSRLSGLAASAGRRSGLEQLGIVLARDREICGSLTVNQVRWTSASAAPS
jgi:hypothetical protein